MSLGYYLTFNGSTQYGALTENTSYAYSNGTVECRFKTTNNTGNNQTLVSKQGAYALFISSNYLLVYLPGGLVINSGVLVNDGKWHHAALVFQYGITNGSKLFLDGTPINNAFTYTNTDQTGLFRIGALSYGEWFSGSIDEVRVWSSVLSDAVILSNYTSINVSPTSSGLTGYWKLNEGSGTVANNSVSGQPAFTLIGSPTWTPAPDYAVNGTNLSTIFYHDTLRLNSNLTRYTGLSIGQRANDISNNSVSVVPTETKYKISGVDICNNLFFQYVELTTVGVNTINIPSWCTKISAILIGGGGGGGGGGAAANRNYSSYDRFSDTTTYFNIDNNGGKGGGGGSGYINNINNQSVTPGSTLNITIGAGGTVGASVANNSHLDGRDGGNGGSTSITISSNNLTYTVNGGQLGKGGPQADNNYENSQVGNGDDGLTDTSGVDGVGGITRFGNYFLSTSSVKTNNYGSGGNGGLGGDFGIREAGPGQTGKPGYARIYFMK